MKMVVADIPIVNIDDRPTTALDNLGRVAAPASPTESHLDAQCDAERLRNGELYCRKPKSARQRQNESGAVLVDWIVQLRPDISISPSSGERQRQQHYSALRRKHVSAQTITTTTKLPGMLLRGCLRLQASEQPRPATVPTGVGSPSTVPTQGSNSSRHPLPLQFWT